MADRHLGKADPRRQLRERGLVRRMPPPVHQHDRDAAQPVVIRRAERGLGGGEAERAQHLAVDVDPLVDLDDAVGQGRGLADRAREDVGPVLITDRERVAETAGDREQRRLAAPLEQRVGRDGGADPHVDRRQRPFGDAAQPPHRLDRRVIVAAGIDRQELHDLHRPVGTLRHHVGERPAPVDRDAAQRGGGGGSGHPRGYRSGRAACRSRGTRCRMEPYRS